MWIYADNRQAEDDRLILTLLGRAVSEHEAQMNSVHFFQRDCHLGDISHVVIEYKIKDILPFFKGIP